MTTEPQWLINEVRRMKDLGKVVDVGEWQSQDVSHRPEMVTLEREYVRIDLAVPSIGDHCVSRTQELYKPNLPWAEDHFQERVGGVPLNPPPSEAWWPFAQQGNAQHKEGEIFSHTYPERIWPRLAGVEDEHRGTSPFNFGIRYEYGDLIDVVNLLIRNPHTRQAYLPIWFPEDTGSIQGQRVPCTLGYHFMIRNNLATIRYDMRSCDLMRHLKDDAYLAARLLQFVVGKLQGRGIGVKASSLVMFISSLHCFLGDSPMMDLMLSKHEKEMDDEDDHGIGWV